MTDEDICFAQDVTDSLCQPGSPFFSIEGRIFERLDNGGCKLACDRFYWRDLVLVLKGAVNGKR